MNTKKGSSLLETRRRNRMFIKDTIFRMEPVTRTAIAEELGLTLPTITTSVNEMISEGILEEIPLPENMLVNATGRKPVAVGFVSGAACAIGVELGPYATRMVLMDLNGNLLETWEERKSTVGYDQMLCRMSEKIQMLARKAGGRPLLGVGIGLPGFIECDKGIIRSHREPDLVGRPLARDMEKLLELPVIIDNNVRLRAIGYEMELKGSRPESFAYFYISKGLACPLMVKDSVLSGYSSGAGEIGHTVICMDHKDGRIPKCLDDLAGERAICDACREKIDSGGAGILKAIVAAEGAMELKHILMAQERGDGDVKAVLSERIEYLGIALANVVNLINPGFVVVDGYIMKNGENKELLKASARNWFFGINEEEVKIIFREFDHYNGARGAAYFVIRRLFLEK